MAGEQLVIYAAIMSEPRNSPPSRPSSVATATMILRTRTLRRQVMFIGMLIAMAQVFLGALPLDKYLTERPTLMAIYWLSCFGLVIFIMLLALYDLLAVRREEKQKSIEK